MSPKEAYSFGDVCNLLKVEQNLKILDSFLFFILKKVIPTIVFPFMKNAIFTYSFNSSILYGTIREDSFDSLYKILLAVRVLLILFIIFLLMILPMLCYKHCMHSREYVFDYFFLYLLFFLHLAYYKNHIVKTMH